MENVIRHSRLKRRRRCIQMIPVFAAISGCSMLLRSQGTIIMSRHVRILGLLCCRRLIGRTTDPPAIGNIAMVLVITFIPSLIPPRPRGTCRDGELLLCSCVLSLVSYDLMRVGNCLLSVRPLARSLRGSNVSRWQWPLNLEIEGEGALPGIRPGN